MSGSRSAPGSRPRRSRAPVTDSMRPAGRRAAGSCCAADELHAQRRVGDALWAELARVYDERELIELLLLIGHYEMLAMTLLSLRVAPDPAPPAGAGGSAFARLVRRAAARRGA